MKSFTFSRLLEEFGGRVTRLFSQPPVKKYLKRALRSSLCAKSASELSRSISVLHKSLFLQLQMTEKGEVV